MKTLTLEDIYSPIEAPIQAVPQTILDILQTDNQLAGDIVKYFFSGKGKLLRPALCLLGAELLQEGASQQVSSSGLTRGSSESDNTLDSRLRGNDNLVRLASSYEIFHAATLIHDDIIDSAYLRRNLPTVNTKWDSQTAVLVGDYLHDKALKVIFEEGNREIFSLFLETAGLVCDGEIHEIGVKNNFNLTEVEYFEIIRKKTSVLLACSLESGARFNGATEEEAKALYRFGIAFGNAFQIIDDCLDFTGNENEFGKTLGADLEAGVLTLPLIRLLATVSSERREEIIQQLQKAQGAKNAKDLSSPTPIGDPLDSRLRGNDNANEFKGLLAEIKESGSLQYAYDKANEFCDSAKNELGSFENNPAKESLLKLLDYVLERKK